MASKKRPKLLALTGDKIKIHIVDGQKRGDIDDLSLTILQFESELEAVKDYGFVTEVTESEWNEWIAFLKQTNKWRVFWIKRLLNAERDKG